MSCERARTSCKVNANLFRVWQISSLILINVKAKKRRRIRVARNVEWNWKLRWIKNANDSKHMASVSDTVGTHTPRDFFFYKMFLSLSDGSHIALTLQPICVFVCKAASRRFPRTLCHRHSLFAIFNTITRTIYKFSLRDTCDSSTMDVVKLSKVELKKYSRTGRRRSSSKS